MTIGMERRARYPVVTAKTACEMVDAPEEGEISKSVPAIEHKGATVM